MNTYEEKLERRRKRLEARAAKKNSEGSALYDRAHQMAEAIPFGQPILIGHHSEKRDRNYRAKIGNTFDRAFKTMDEAKALAGRAASVGTGGISSDDPEAVQKLKAELTGLEAKQVLMVAVNKALRSKDPAAALAAAGISDADANLYMNPIPRWAGDKEKSFASYQLSNNGANIRRIKDRIEQLQKAATRETKEVLHNSGVRLVENAEANRVQLFFDGKPADEIRAELKSRGFRWSPSEGAWQRHLNNSGIFAAKCILEKLAGG